MVSSSTKSMGEASGGGEHTALVNGKLLSGEALLEHARNKGLCHKCLETITHRRIRKKFGISRGWEPITVTDSVAGNYTVYKGYCLQPTCWTLEEAQIILGEKKAKSSKASRRTTGSSHGSRRTSRRPRASASAAMLSAPVNSLRSRAAGDDDCERRSPPRSRSREEKTPGFYQLPYIDETRLIEDSARRFGHTTGGPSFASRSSGASNTSDYSIRSEDPSRKSKALGLGTLLGATDDNRTRSNSGSEMVSFRSAEGIEEGRSRKKRASLAVPMRKGPCESVSNVAPRRISVHGAVDPRRMPLQSSSLHSRYDAGRHADVRRYSGPNHDTGTSSTPSILEMMHKNAADSYSTPHSSQERRNNFDSSNESLQYQNLRTSNHGDGRKRINSSDELPTVSNHSSDGANSADSSSGDSHRNMSNTIANKCSILEALLRAHAMETMDHDQVERLWSNLHDIYKRSPSSSKTKSAPIRTTLYVLEQERSSEEVYRLGWKLLAQIMVSPLEVLTDYNIVQNLFRAMTLAFDQEIASGGTKNIQSLTQVLFALFELHGDIAASVVSSMISVLDRSKRLQWAAALLDSLLEADTESDFFAQALLIINKLLSLKSAGIDSGLISPEEEMMMLTMLIGFVVSVLSGYEQHSIDRYEILKSKSAISLISYITSRAGMSAITDRHYECIEVVCETIGRHLEDAELVHEGSRALLALHTLMADSDLNDGSMGSRETKNALALLEKLLLQTPDEASDKVSSDHGVDSKPLAQLLLGILLHSTIDQQQVRLLTNRGIPKQLITMLGDRTLSVAASALVLGVAKRDPSLFRADPEILPTLESSLGNDAVLSDTKANVCSIISSLMTQDSNWSEAHSVDIQSFIRILGSDEDSVDLLKAAQSTLSEIIKLLPDAEFSQQQQLLMTAASEIAQSNENPARVTCGFELIGTILQRSYERETFTAEETIISIVKSMELHFCSIEVVTSCCRLLRKIVNLGDNSRVIAGTGVLRLIINAIMIYPTSKEFLLEAMAILDIFASQASFRTTFDDTEAEAAITSLLAASQYKPDVLAMAFGTLDSIVKYNPTPSKAPPIQAVVLNCIVMALKTYAGNEDVSSPSLKLLQTYSYNENSLSLMREQSASLVPILSNSNGLSQETCEKARFIMCRLYNQYNGFAARESRGGSASA